MSKFGNISVGAIFEANGQKYRKTNNLAYVDIVTGFETYWDPLFDNKIGEVAETPTTTTQGPPNQKFVTNPNTRVTVPNKDYKPAEEFFQELFASGLIDCDAKDYGAIVAKCIEWGKSVQRAAKAKATPKKKTSKKASKKANGGSTGNKAGIDTGNQAGPSPVPGT